MFCTRCGTQIPDGAAFCPGCGAPADNSPPDPQANTGDWNRQYQPSGGQPNYGYGQPNYSQPNYGQNRPYYGAGPRPKERLVAIILCCVGFCGLSGLHRFYTGKIGTGVLWLLTGGCFLIGTIVDLIALLDGSFRDYYGNPLI